MNTLKKVVFLLFFGLPLKQFCMEEKLNTFFLILSKKEFTDLVKEQIKKGKVNFIDNKNTPALIHTTIYGYTKAATLLIKNKANLNIQDKENNNDTALMCAARHGRNHIVKWLIDNKANLNLQNKDGDTALMIAIKSNNIEIAKMLINNNADLNIQNESGATALVYAIILMEGNVETAKLLIDKGASVTFKRNGQVFLDTWNTARKLKESMNEKLDKLSNEERRKIDQMLTLPEYVKEIRNKFKAHLIDHISVEPVCDMVLDYVF